MIKVGTLKSVKTQFTYIGTSSLRNAQPHAVPEAAVCDNGSKKKSQEGTVSFWSIYHKQHHEARISNERA